MDTVNQLSKTLESNAVKLADACFCPDAERELLGCLIMRPENYGAVRSVLEKEDFSCTFCREVFQAMGVLGGNLSGYRMYFDSVSIAQYFKDTDRLYKLADWPGGGPSAFVGDLVVSVTDVGKWPALTMDVLHASLRRRILTSIDNVIQDLIVAEHPKGIAVELAVVAGEVTRRVLESIQVLHNDFDAIYSQEAQRQDG